LILGLSNLGLASAKTVDLAAADGILALSAPESDGASVGVAAVVTVYGTTSITGQAASGTAQLYSAAGGDPEVAEKMEQVGDILSGPLTGISTLVATNNGAQAQQMANVESTITAGAGLVNNKDVGSLVDFGLSLLGLSGAGCHP